MSLYKPRGYSVNDFLSWHSRGELVLNPKFQRRNVWEPKAKSHLVDTILRGLPIPIIFIRQNIDLVTRSTIREVVDGQQRLRSIIEFSEDEFSILKSQNEEFGGQVFSELSSSNQAKILAYEFSVVILEGISDADVLDIFARMNTYSLRLTSQELLNAAFFGEFKKTIYELGYKHLEFWRENKILSDKEITRMAEADLTTELVIAMLDGIQKRQQLLTRGFYEKYDDEFPDKRRIETQFDTIISLISRCLDKELPRSSFRTKAMFYSLFCAFYHLIFGLRDSSKDLGTGKYLSKLNQMQLDNIKESLLELQQTYKQEPLSPELKRFAEYASRSTTDRERRLFKTKIIFSHMRDAIK